MTTYSDINHIPLARYGLIMADPPWQFKTRSQKGITPKGAGGQYSTMTLEDIKAMRVSNIAAPDCILWLWATNPMLPVAFDVLNSWGFTFKTAGHWSKKTVNGKQAFGTGYILRCAGEPFLIGTIGRPKTAKNVRSVIEGPVREHSRKPEKAFKEADRLCGDVPKLELFSRQERAGWDVFGNQTERFAAEELT